MKKQHPIVGRIMIAFGVLGVILCFVVLMSTWVVGGRVVHATSGVVDQVESRLDQLVTVAVDTQTGVEATRKVARELETRIREQAKSRLQEAVKPDPEAMAKIDTLEARLSAGVIKVRKLADSADALLLFSQDMMTILQSTGIFFNRNPESFDQIKSSLQSGRNELADLEERVLQLKGRVTDIRSGVKSSAQDLETKMLSDKIDTSLINVSKYAHGFELAVTKVVDAAKQIQTKIRNTILLIQLLLTVLLVWPIAAQLSLFKLGRIWSQRESK